MPVFIRIFNNLSEEDLRNHNNHFTLSHFADVNISAGNGIILANSERKYIFGMTRATSRPYIPTEPQNIFSDTRYNQWELDIEPITYFGNPISYEDFCELIGGNPDYRTNIYKGFVNEFAKAFVADGIGRIAPDSAKILKRLDIIMQIQ